MQLGPSSNDHIRIRAITTLAEGRYRLQKYTFDYLRRDGTWQQLSREVYARGDSATILLYCRSRGTVVLTRQFRLPVLVNGDTAGFLIETPAGLVGCELPIAAIVRETEEETGFRVNRVREVFSAYLSPASITERMHFFVAEYDTDNCISPGGGVATEGEDIEVLEISFREAWTMVDRGEIRDAKTIMLLLYAKSRKLLDHRKPTG
jgi:nudix-type nucleoside diphosphatase (YffH/AdpP family)